MNALRTPPRTFSWGWVRQCMVDERRRHTLCLGFTLISMLILTVMAVLAAAMPLFPFDLVASQRLQTIENPLFFWVMEAVSLPGFMPWSVVIFGIISLLIGWLVRWRDGFYLAGLTLFQGIITTILRVVIGRPRPSPELVDVAAEIGSTSFPSGHVMVYVVFFGFLFFLVWLWFPRTPQRTLLLSVALFLIVWIGPARVYLGAHWVSDILSAYLLGFVILWMGIELYLKYILFSTSRPAPAR